MNDNFTDNITPLIEQKSYDKDLPKGEQAAHNSEVRKRIDDLLERKRLKDLLDDSDDWDI
jgi:hypothetical protein